jgi:predicted Zn-dependent protease
VQYSNAQFQAHATTTWLVTSEGSIVRKSAGIYQQSFGVGTQAQDGMRLDRSYASTGTLLKDLDSQDVFEKHAQTLIASLAELRKAPLVDEEYHGPLLLSADASADTMRTLLGGRRNGHTAKAGHGGAHQRSFLILFT